MLPYGSRRNSCIVVVCPRIADPWTNHDQAGDATGFIWGDTTAAVAYSFSVHLARGFSGRAVAGPTMSSSLTNSALQYSRYQKKKAPAEFQKVSAIIVFSRRGCQAVDDVDDEDEYVLLTIHDILHTKNPYNGLDPLYQEISLHHVESNFVWAKR